MPTIIGAMIIGMAIMCHPRGFWESLGLMVSMMILTPVRTVVYIFTRWLLETKVGP